MCKNRLIKMMIGVKLKKERVIIRIISLIKTLMNLMILTKLFKNRINMVMKSIQIILIIKIKNKKFMDIRNKVEREHKLETKIKIDG